MVRAIGCAPRLRSISGFILRLLIPCRVLRLIHARTETPADQSRVPDVGCGGNLDPVANVLRGNPDSIRAKPERCDQQAYNPFIVNAGCKIPAGTSLENFLR
jgi:uroporphyrinogen-III decarboxylase